MRLRFFCLTSASLLLLPCSAAAQSTKALDADIVVRGLAALQEAYEDYVLATAEMVPEDLYSYRPTEEVRTLGAILAHIAGTNYLFCAAAAREPNPNTERLVRTRTTKAAIISALEDSFEYCHNVYETTTTADMVEKTTLLGAEYEVSTVLAGNSAHISEHYGNLVTYMRINGIVPPSTQGH